MIFVVDCTKKSPHRNFRFEFPMRRERMYGDDGSVLACPTGSAQLMMKIGCGSQITVRRDGSLSDAKVIMVLIPRFAECLFPVIPRST